MKMVEKKSHNLMKNFIAGFIAVALLVLGVCFYATDSGLVMASDSKVKTEDGGYAVKTYSATDFAKFRGDKYTYPKLTAADGSDYQEWLFAGWFTDETCKTSVGSEAKTAEGNVYAKFVDADLSYIKCQVTPETDVDSEQAHMRVISTVDSKYYSGTGFYITYKGHEPRRCATDNVYRRLSATDDGMECAYSPIAFNEHAEYLFALRLTDIGNTNFDEAFYIQSYWVTLDGTEVLGMSRYARIEDSYEKIVNVPVRLYASDVEVTSGSVSVSFDANQFSLYTTDEYPNGYDGGKGFTVTSVNTGTNGKITVTGTADNGVAEGLFVNLRLQLKKDATLESYTEFTVDGETFVNGEISVTGLDVSNVIFKNYPVAYTAGTVDTSWYKGFEDNNTFVISSAADLYGLASIVNATSGDYASEQFSGDIIILGSDIIVNTATLDPETDATSYITWTPIGKKGAAFAGTFDGQGNKISGIYVNATADNAGLFGVASGSTIQELEIKNSCFNSAKGVLGSVVGYATNTKFMNIRSNAYVIGGAAAIGGIVGSVDDASAELNISNCWFDGNITGTTYCGGIVGRFNKGTSTISDCLVTGSVKGNVSGNTASVGGIVGGMPATNSPTLEISTSISVGSVEGVNSGGVIGYRASSSATAYATLTLNNLYTTHTKGIGTQSGTANPGNVKDTTNKSIDPSTLNGHVAYDTINDGLSVLTSQVKGGAWAIREQSDNLKDGVPVPAAFADEWIDVAWYYDAEKSADNGETYSVGTAEELYGFSAISQDYSFDSDTIQLANDITANTGKATSWATGTTTPDREWTPIGNSTTSFKGTFDGQKHFIKGIYVNATTQNTGLFGYAENATIQNLQLINSYIHSAVDRVGGIAGYYTGNMYRVYCDAIVVSTRDKASDCGGLIGYYNGVANTTNEISECWFEGTAKGFSRTGGIVGYIQNGTKEISDTLVTGEVITTTTTRNGQTGGMIGSLNDSTDVDVEINSSLSAGTITDNYSDQTKRQSGGIIGWKKANATITFDNVYTTFGQGIGTQTTPSNTPAVEADITSKIKIDNVKGNNVYGVNDYARLNLDYYLYNSIWVARENDTTVPRCFVGTVVDESDIIEDTSAHIAWYDANTEATTFEIKTANDLLGFAVKVNEGVTFSGTTVKLVNDIELNRGWNAPETVDDPFVEPDITWTPIGGSKKFQGTFDGQGKTIKGIYVTQAENYVGLFGAAQGATITNFSLMNSYFEQTGNNHWTGSTVGYIYENDSLVSRIYSDAIVISAGRQIGGIAGRAEGTVTKCWYNGEIKATRSSSNILAGGIVGASNKTTNSTALAISNCLNSADIIYNVTHSNTTNVGVGGIYGATYGATVSLEITECINSGEIKLQENAVAGAVAGLINQASTVYDISNCYTRTDALSNKTVSATSGILGATVNSPQGTVSACDAKALTELQGVDVYKEVAEGGLNLNYATWIARTNDVPVPRCFVGSIVAAGDTVEDNSGRVYVNTDWYDDNPDATVFEIETAHELAGLAQLVNDGITFDNKTINLVKDIDFNKGWAAPATTADNVVTPVNTWMPIGNSSSASFQGTFNGHGNTISGIYVDEDVETAETGLFGRTVNCTIRDLQLENSYFRTTKVNMGSIIGYGDGILTNVYSDAFLYSTKGQVGGLVGYTLKTNDKILSMDGCWFDGDINIVYSSATGNLNSGGLLGRANTGDVTINNCLYTGNLIFSYTSTDLTESPNARVGGVCGMDNYGSNKSYSSIQISNTISAGTIEGTLVADIENPKLNGVSTVFGQARGTASSCENVYTMTVIKKYFKASDKTDVVNNTIGAAIYKSNDAANTIFDINVSYEKENFFGLGAQLLTNLDFVQDAEETIWAARRGQLPAPATLVADNDKLSIGNLDKANTSWLEDDINNGTSEDTPYIIDSVEDLYGFAVHSKTYDFAGKFIKLNQNIDVNPGEYKEDWAEGTAASLPWYSIGVAEDGLRFAGYFDGANKTISGIYVKQSKEYLGLFAAIEENAVVKNLRLENSYIEQTGSGATGSIIGDCRGTVDNVYSDAIIVSSGNYAGGIVACANGFSYTRDEANEEARTSKTISNCWYDGTINMKKQFCGGIMGGIVQGEWTLKNCVFTGNINSLYKLADKTKKPYAYAGGICGDINTPAHEYGSDETTITGNTPSKLVLDSCVSTGTIETSVYDRGAGAIVGRIRSAASQASKLEMINVFASRDAGWGEVGHSADASIVEGVAVWTNSTDRMIGYCTEKTVTSHYAGGSLNFTDDFVLRKEGVPVPKTFENMTKKVTKVESTELNELLCLSTMDTTWTTESAVNNGLGHYVLRTTGKKYDDFTSYLEALKGKGFKAYVALSGDTSEGVVAYVDKDSASDGVYNVIYRQAEGEWIVNVLFVASTESVTLTISNGFDSLSPDLVSNSIEEGTVSLSMLKLTGSGSESEYYYGNSFVFKLPTGKFVVVDGGEGDDDKEDDIDNGDFKGLVSYLQELRDDKTKPVEIQAWIVTHQHGDHFDVMKDFVNNDEAIEGLRVNALYINEPSQEAMLCTPSEGNIMKNVVQQYRGIRMLQDVDGNPTKVYWCQTGQKYYFDGLTMDVIQSQEQIEVKNYGPYNAALFTNKKDFNTASMNLLFTTSNDKKVLITGDSNQVNMKHIMSMYGDNSKKLANINVYQAPHHGKNTSFNISSADNKFTNYLAELARENVIEAGKFDVTLFPCSKYYGIDCNDTGAFPAAKETNQYLIYNKSTRAYHYGSGTVVIELGEVVQKTE